MYATIASLRPPRCAPMDASASGDAPQALLRRSDLTRRWRDREMSNFDYIMALNAVAGRTYNDVTQYPVFPWVIADYTSEQLRLDDPATYRDLSKPVGALNEARLARFRERHDAFDDPEIPKFHYGSHYSTAGTTIFYLIRLEPFTTLAHQLQGGKFDHADRLFDDVASTYEGVTTDMSDVKELVPEWYYLRDVRERQPRRLRRETVRETRGRRASAALGARRAGFRGEESRRARERIRQRTSPPLDRPHLRVQTARRGGD